MTADELLACLTDRPCEVCKFHTDLGCSKWSCVFEGKTEEWIPCSERLPEENGQYLITVKYVHVDGYEDIYAEHGDWADGKWDMFCFGHCGEVESILAWMPLPKPWKENRMSDTINRADVLKFVRTLPSEEGMTKGLLEMSVKQLPSAEPQIIRCKDCRWGREVCGNIECFADSYAPDYHGYEWFCPNGERKGEKNDRT